MVAGDKRSFCCRHDEHECCAKCECSCHQKETNGCDRLHTDDSHTEAFEERQSKTGFVNEEWKGGNRCCTYCGVIGVGDDHLRLCKPRRDYYTKAEINELLARRPRG